jgi:NADH:ubiquinone oxidoreductase subunit E
MSEPLDVYVCVGSSCHVRGSERVIACLQSLIAERELEARVTLKGSFCLENCSAGVSVRVGEKLLAGVLPETTVDVVWPEIAEQLGGAV